MVTVTKYIIALKLCALTSGDCYGTNIGKTYDTFTGCVKGGATEIIRMTNKHLDRFEESKLYVTYWCNEQNFEQTDAENISNKTATQRIPKSE